MLGLFSSRSHRDAQEYAKELRRGLRESARHGRGRLHELGVSASDGAHRVGHRIEDGSRRAWELTEESAREIDDRVHDNPWPYIAAGTALGLAIGYMLGRR
ncbi:DUF883 family protein [Halotalea alkalilenta]|uniref:DUF883 family protein n=1 Tax=Halotalea alkalilenta TaxID=376489 RepID=UPI0006949BF0|nr:DUF883 family protein [Halotalea alkalilenta]